MSSNARGGENKGRLNPTQVTEGGVKVKQLSGGRMLLLLPLSYISCYPDDILGIDRNRK